LVRRRGASEHIWHEGTKSALLRFSARAKD
jgi:hypothetical protein